AGSTATQYAAAGAGLYLAWNSANGTNNVITSYSVQRSDNGGAWYDAGAGGGRTVYAHSTPGVYSRWRVYANAPYGSNDWQYSPYVYTRSNPTPPTSVSVTPTTTYTGKNVTVSWNAGGAGTGVAISKYEVYCNDTKVGETTALSLTVAAPSTAGNAVYKVKTIGTVSGYNSALSSASATVIVANPRSTGTLNKSSVEMDDVSTIGITVTPSNAAYNHKVIWYTSLHTVTHTLAVGVTTDTLNPIPLAWCTAYPNGTSGTANAKLETYNGTTKIGELIYPFTVIVPATVLPTVSALARAPVDGFTGLYLKGISKAVLTATAAGAQGSTIPAGNYSMAGGGGTGNTNPWTTPILTSIGTNAMSVTVVDTRGRIASRTENITVTDYVNPSISSVLAERCLSNGTANNDGTYVKVKATLAVTSLSGNNPIAVAKVEYRKRGVETWTLGTNAFVNDTYSVVGGNNITTPEAYEIRILLTDTVGKSATHTLIISPSSRLYDFRTDRASIGRIAGTEANKFLLPDDWTTNVKLGNINGEGKVGTVAGKVLATGTGGVVEASGIDASTLISSSNLVSSVNSASGIDVDSLGGRNSGGYAKRYTSTSGAGVLSNAISNFGVNEGVLLVVVTDSANLNTYAGIYRHKLYQVATFMNLWQQGLSYGAHNNGGTLAINGSVGSLLYTVTLIG
ncbi:MAG: DUF859 family phage minor structural protein, partial [Candidatus Sumerlaeales bacterium]|nr:DUF859 family phage minor structural protein [Candidatus Sumerlaeales bacterium]